MNEVEKKEIKEIASIVDKALKSKYEWTDEKALEVADELVNKLGYGKVEDYKKQIETDKEYEKNLNNIINKYLEKERTYKKEIERLNKDLEYYQKENDRLYKQKRDLEDQMIAYGWAEYVNDKVLTLKDSKQQAIKKSAEGLKSYMYDLPNNTQMEEIETKAINDLLKECSIGSTNKTICPVCGGGMDETYMGRQYCKNCEDKLNQD